MGNSKRYRSIDLIKGILIIAVIFTHCEWSDKERLLFLFPFWIDMAVPCFLVLSGFVTANSYSSKGLNNLKQMFQPRLIVSKFIRYTIPFLFIFILEVLTLQIGGQVEFDVFSLLSAFLRGGYGPGSYYYPILVQFVFISPLIYLVIKKYGHTGLVSCFVANGVYEVVQSSIGLSEAYYRLLIFRYIFVIAFGCYLAINKEAINNISLWLCFAVGFTYIIVFKYLGATPVVIKYWVGTSLLASLYILPLFQVIFIDIKCKILELLGKASYNIFLVQMAYFCVSDTIYDLVPNRVLQLIINVLVCCTLGLAFYYVENPVTSAVIKCINRKS